MQYTQYLFKSYAFLLFFFLKTQINFEFGMQLCNVEML